MSSETLKKRRKEQYLARGKNEIPEWVFMTPGQIEWSEGEEGKRGGREPIGHKVRRADGHEEFSKSRFHESLRQSGHSASEASRHATYIRLHSSDERG
jgi:hypothetical protein